MDRLNMHVIGLFRIAPMITIDVLATLAGFAISLWGMNVNEFSLSYPDTLVFVIQAALINVLFYGLLKMYDCLWEYASIDEALRLVLVSLIACATGDIFGYLLTGVNFSNTRIYYCLVIVFYDVFGCAFYYSYLVREKKLVSVWRDIEWIATLANNWRRRNWVAYG